MTPNAVYTLVTPPASEPVSLDEAKLHARIDTTEEDAAVTAMIVSAREMVERATGRCLVTQTWTLTLDRWPGNRDEWWDGVREGPITILDSAWVELRKTPIGAITSVVTKDEADVATTWDSANYYLERQPNGFGRLVRKRGQVWPIVVSRTAGAIQITFTAGYGANASDVPAALRQAIKLLVAHWYQNREAGDPAARQIMPMGVKAILDSFRAGR